MKKLIVILLLLQGVNSDAQKRNYHWCFGDSAGIDFNNLNNPSATTSILCSKGSSTSIADINGNLQLYCSYDTDLFNGTGFSWNGEVYTKNNTLMQDGDSLIFGGWYDEVIVVPSPGDSAKVYLFYVGIINGAPMGYHYALVDLNYNGGLGKVVQKNIQLNNEIMIDALAAVKHGNGRDWWVIAKNRYNLYASDTILEYLVTPSGITGPFKLNSTVPNYPSFSNFTFSSDGSKFLYTAVTGLIMTLDFDRCTGQISNPVVIKPELGGGERRLDMGFMLFTKRHFNLCFTKYNSLHNRSIQFNCT